MRKSAFSRVFAATDIRLHVAAHSHHPWPDVTHDAQMQYWQDSARLLDGKWDHVLGTVRRRAAAHVARHLGLADPSTITFAPNTHVLLCGILSCLDLGRPIRVLTTDSEFHSFTRQMARLEEDGLVRVTPIPARPFKTLAARLAAAAGRGEADLVYVSQVFFNSGYALTEGELLAVATALPRAEILFVVDGYHSFLARPVDWSTLRMRAFYLSGGYKYAMAGEGVCFMHAPPGLGPRPRFTGWYAAFGALSGAQAGQVPYAEDATRFDGATFDPSGLYRLNAVMDWLESEGLTVAAMDAHVRDLQIRFLDALGPDSVGPLSRRSLLVDPATGRCGRFLTFETPEAGRLYEALRARGVVTDFRKNRLRSGFGIYHEPEDVEGLVGHVERAVALL